MIYQKIYKNSVANHIKKKRKVHSNMLCCTFVIRKYQLGYYFLTKKHLKSSKLLNLLWERVIHAWNLILNICNMKQFCFSGIGNLILIAQTIQSNLQKFELYVFGTAKYAMRYQRCNEGTKYDIHLSLSNVTFCLILQKHLMQLSLDTLGVREAF